MFDFIEFSLLDVLDILLVALLLFYIYKLLKGTVAINIVIGVAIIFVIWKITEVLNMEMLSGILGTLLGGGVIALIIVFQQEIRKFLLMIGTTNFTNKRNFLKQLKVFTNRDWLRNQYRNYYQRVSKFVKIKNRCIDCY